MHRTVKAIVYIIISFFGSSKVEVVMNDSNSVQFSALNNAVINISSS